MKAGLGRFLWLWLPVMAVLLLGLKRAWMTGQADPWDWSLVAALIGAGAGVMLAKRGWPILLWVAMGTTGTALLFCIIAAARAPDGQAAIGLMAVAALAVFGGAEVRRRRWPIGLALLGLAGFLSLRGPDQPIAPSPDRPALAVITALPLFWGEAGRADAPVITLLRTRFDVQPVDDPLALAGSGARRLLLAQPRALSPAQMVAIDQWVRSGGTALVLADPLLRWPSALPLGDRRRAPSASLLAPLLTHWDFGADHVQDRELRYLAPDGTLVTMSGLQVFLTDKYGRRVGPNDGIVHRKRIGKGDVLLLGDADLLDDRLWLADPARPLDPRLWTADTPARLVHWLNGATIDRRHWMREGGDVMLAIRWAFLAGTGWAIVGALLLSRRTGLTEQGTNHENLLERGVIIG